MMAVGMLVAENDFATCHDGREIFCIRIYLDNTYKKRWDVSDKSFENIVTNNTFYNNNSLDEYSTHVMSSEERNLHREYNAIAEMNGTKYFQCKDLLDKKVK